MSVVMIGVDPHKASVSIEARDTVTERLVATGRFEMSTPGYRQLRALAKQWKDRVWAIEGTSGTGRPLAQRLLADGEVVLDVPAKLAARSRVFDTGQGRKTDAHDAHAIVMVALRDQGLRQVREDDALLMLRLLIDRRDELGKARVQGLSRLHRHFLHLIPGGAPTKKSVQQYRRLLATVRPRDPVGKARRRMAAEQVRELVRLDAQLKAMKTELKSAVLATGSRLMDLHGIGPVNAARILADVGDVARFPDRNHFASWTGTAPIDASSGQHIRHRLSRAGNRRVNHALHMAAVDSTCATTPTGGPTSAARPPPARPAPRPCAASNGGSPTRSTGSSSPTPQPASRSRWRQVGLGTPGRHSHPARPTCPRTSALRISHNPNPPMPP